jgi:HTH-type transcriptional regulator / antitoxin HigA
MLHWAVRVLAIPVLRAFWEKHPQAQGPLRAWFKEAVRARWQSPQDIKRQYASASFVGSHRVVFNIKGNAFRLVAHVRYDTGFVYIRFIGTHEEYDAIDVATVWGQQMDIRPIRNESDYRRVMTEIDALLEAKPGSKDAERLEVLSVLAEDYESKHWPIEPPSPVEAIIFRMEQFGMSRADLEPYIGSRARVSEVLNGRRPLSLQMIRRLHEGLGIPLECLIQPIKAKRVSRKPGTRSRKKSAS